MSLLGGATSAFGQLPAVVENAIKAAVPASMTMPLVRSVGIAYDHRPYESATPLNRSCSFGLDIGAEATLVKVDANFVAAVNQISAAAGAGGGLSSLSSLTSFVGAKVHLHKGFGAVDLGGSLFFLMGYLMYGGDLKITLYDPPEGPTYALRGKYSYTNLSYIEARAASAELLVSRRLAFADPYIGVGGIYLWGNMILPVTFLGTNYNVALDSTSAYSFYAFGGVGLDFGGSGLRIAVEGAYSLAGNPHLGAKLSLRL